jgi:phosphoglycerate dehydrogenase-like enzyme
VAGLSRVVVTWPGFALGAGASILREAGVEVQLAPKPAIRTPDELAAIIGDASAVIASTDLLDETVFAQCPALRVVARVGVGYDAVDVAAATRHRVAVTITPGANTSSVADHTLALMLAVVRWVASQDASVRGGRWRPDDAPVPGELAGSTVGIVGYGAIGQLVGRRLSGFDVEILAADPAYSGGGAAEPVSLPELLRRARVVTLHVPLLAATTRLIDRDAIASMRRDAILVNTSRGGVVDEDALFAALQAGALLGAGLDVLVDEPPRATSRFAALPNVVFTPHVAGLSDRSRDAMTSMAATAVLDVLAGRTPTGLVNPDALAG